MIHRVPLGPVIPAPEVATAQAQRCTLRMPSSPHLGHFLCLGGGTGYTVPSLSPHCGPGCSAPSIAFELERGARGQRHFPALSTPHLTSDLGVGVGGTASRLCTMSTPVQAGPWLPGAPAAAAGGSGIRPLAPPGVPARSGAGSPREMHPLCDCSQFFRRDHRFVAGTVVVQNRNKCLRVTFFLSPFF